jgi:C_GCAxxG_C_C family probable redox protein
MYYLPALTAKETSMTPEKCQQAKTRALAGYLDPGPAHLNCAQTVLFSGLVVTDQEPDLVNVANYLGGGIARMGQACGALTGAAVALGLYDLAAGRATPKNSAFDPMQRLVKDFEEEFGAVTCKGLLGHDISTAQGFREAKKSQALARCPEFVSWVIDRLNAVLCEEPGRG